LLGGGALPFLTGFIGDAEGAGLTLALFGLTTCGFFDGLGFGLFAQQFRLGALAGVFLAGAAFGLVLLALNFISGAAALVLVATATLVGLFFSRCHALLLEVQGCEQIAHQVILKC
jgi:drug/metabolite transporter (DMT)-like permease